MMEKILTIVIPTYNMESYLRKCLDSLIIDDKDLFERLEVLVINDGSKDASSTIAHEYQDKYPLLTIISPSKYSTLLRFDGSNSVRNNLKYVTRVIRE